MGGNNVGTITAELNVNPSGFVQGIDVSIQSLQKFVKEVGKVSNGGFKPIQDSLSKLSNSTKAMSAESKAWLAPLQKQFSDISKSASNFSTLKEQLHQLNNQLQTADNYIAIGAARAVLSSKAMKDGAEQHAAKIQNLIEQYRQLEIELKKISQLESNRAIVAGGTPLQKSIQSGMYVGAVSGTDPTKGTIALIRAELRTLAADLSSFGVSKEVIQKTAEFDALAQRVKTLKQTLVDLQKTIIAGQTATATSAQQAEALTAQKRISTGFAAGGEFTKEITGITHQGAKLDENLRIQEYQRLRKETDALLASNQNLGKSTLDLQQKKENLTKAMANEKMMYQSIKGTTDADSTARQKHNDAYVANEKALKAINKEMGSFATSSRRMSMNIKDLIAWQAEWYLSQGLIFGALNFFKKAIGNMTEFEQRLANLKAVTGSTTVETEAMGRSARNLGMKSRLSALEIADGMTILGQAGFTAKETIAGMEAVVALSTSTLTDMKTSVDLVTTALRAFEMNADKSANIANTLAAVVNYSKLNMQDLKTSFNYVASAGHTANLSLEQVTAALGIMRDRGIQASTAGTGLRGILGALIAPTDRFRKEIEKVGLTMGLVNPLYNDFGDILVRLRDSGFNVANAFAGVDKRQAGAIITIIQGADAYKNLTNRITNTNAAFEMQSIQLETVQSAWLMFKNIIVETGLKIGTALLPALNSILVPVTSFTRSLSDISSSMPSWTSTLLQGAASVVVLTGAIGIAIKVIGPFIASILGIEASVGLLGTTIAKLITVGTWLTSGIGLIVTTIAILLTSIGMAISHYNTLTKKTIELNNASLKSVTSLREVQEEIKKNANNQEGLKRILDQLVLVYPELTDKIDKNKVSVKSLTNATTELINEKMRLLLLSNETTIKENRKQIKEQNLGGEPLYYEGKIISYRPMKESYDEMIAKVKQLKLESYTADKDRQEDIDKEIKKRTTVIGLINQQLERLRVLDLEARRTPGVEGASTISIQSAKVQRDTLKKEIETIYGTGDALERLGRVSKKGILDQIERENKELIDKTNQLSSDLINAKKSNLKREFDAIDKTRAGLEKARLEKDLASGKALYDKNRKQVLSESDRAIFDAFAANEKAIARQKWEKSKEASVARQVEVDRISFEDKINDEIYRNEREASAAKIAALRADGQHQIADLKEQEEKELAIKKEYQEKLRNLDVMFLKEAQDPTKKELYGLNLKQLQKTSDYLKLAASHKNTFNIKMESSQKVFNENQRKTQEEFDSSLLDHKRSAEKTLEKEQRDSLKAQGKIRRVWNADVEKIEEEHALKLETIQKDLNEDLRHLAEDFKKQGISDYENDPAFKAQKDFYESIARGRVTAAGEKKDADVKNATFGKTPLEGFTAGIESANKSLGTLGDNIEKLTTGTIKSFTDGSTDAFVAWTDGSKSAGDAFKDFTELFLREVHKQITQLLVLYAVQQLVGLAKAVISPVASGGPSPAYTKATSGMTMFGNASGGYLATGGILPNIKSFRKFSSGGMTSSPALALLGDNASRKELVIPSENISENKVSGYTRNKGEESKDNVIINLFDKALVPALIAEYPNSVLNVISADIMKRGMTFQAIRSVR